MKNKVIFLLILLSLVAVSGVSYANKESSTGSSTNSGKFYTGHPTATYTEVHSGQSVTVDRNLSRTDASDGHPFN